MTKKIAVDGGRFRCRYPIIHGIGFALVSKPDKGIHWQATNIHTCRDYINDDIMSFVNKGGRRVGGIDMARLRLLVCAHKSKEEYIFSAKHIINIYEDLAGFKTKSRIVTPKYSGTGSAWLITGPEEWMRCTQLVSMVTLIIRIVFRAKLEAPNNIEELESSWKELSHDSYSPSYRYGDIHTYLPECYPKWRMIMENFYELFDPSIEFYPKNSGGLWHSAGGIYQLCKFHSTIRKLDNKMKKLWKAEYKDRYKKEKKS